MPPFEQTGIYTIMHLYGQPPSRKVLCATAKASISITKDGGEPHHLKAGDGFILHEGFSGIWEAVTTTRKDYVIRTR
ncbi:MAG: cupin domain-containing protein [Oxalobacter sp.]